MIVPSYVQSSGWRLIHLVWVDATTTWCGLRLPNDVTAAPTPDIEPIGQRRYCEECEGLASRLGAGSSGEGAGPARR